MEGTVLTWTRVERPPAGFPPGRVVALVERGAERVYAVWEGPGAPPMDRRVRLAQERGLWVARP